MKKVLFIASEAVPFIKTGGLADVVGSLPKYFDKEEFDVRVMIPKYSCIKQELKEDVYKRQHPYCAAWTDRSVNMGYRLSAWIRPIKRPRAW